MEELQILLIDDEAAMTIRRAAMAMRRGGRRRVRLVEGEPQLLRVEGRVALQRVAAELSRVLESMRPAAT